MKTFTICLFLTLAAQAMGQESAFDVASAKQMILQANTMHLELRRNLQYSFSGYHLLPPSGSEMHEAEVQASLREFGTRFSHNENYEIEGFYSSTSDAFALHFEAIAEEDDAVLEDRTYYYDGLVAQEIDDQTATAKLYGSGAFPNSYTNPETLVTHVGGAATLEDWINNFDHEVRFETGRDENPCIVLALRWKNKFNGHVIENCDEIWFDRLRGLLPFRRVTGPTLVDGAVKTRAQSTYFSIKELQPNVYVVSGVEAEYPTGSPDGEMAKVVIRFFDMRWENLSDSAVAALVPDATNYDQIYTDF